MWKWILDYLFRCDIANIYIISKISVLYAEHICNQQSPIYCHKSIISRPSPGYPASHQEQTANYTVRYTAQIAILRCAEFKFPSNIAFQPVLKYNQTVGRLGSFSVKKNIEQIQNDVGISIIIIILYTVLVEIGAFVFSLTRLENCHGNIDFQDLWPNSLEIPNIWAVIYGIKKFY